MLSRRSTRGLPVKRIRRRCSSSTAPESRGLVLGRALPRLLRGQGLSRAGSQPSRPRRQRHIEALCRKCSIADYVDDVASVADTLQARPAMIGHSMGGFVVQKYLESHEAPRLAHRSHLFPRGGSAG